MASTVCTIKHITVTTVVNGTQYFGGVDKEGVELPNIQTEIVSVPDKRTYFCSNCLRVFDGTNTFDEVKKHFGTFPLD